MKITLKMSALLGRLTGCLLLCSTILITGCNKDPQVCVKCNAAFAHQKDIKQILHYDTELSLKEKFRFYYKENLIDSIGKVSYGTDFPGDSTTTRLKVYYPSKDCLPSSYVALTQTPNDPLAIEKGNMLQSGNFILSKHLSYYNDADFATVNRSADIDYGYNNAGQVTNRNGSDYFILVWGKYSNQNKYSYTGDNITKIVADKEQSGYDLTITFDNNNNPFSIQAGALYYLNLTSYPDEEYFETICRDRNNPTSMHLQGTDGGPYGEFSLDITFTYTYTADHYPATVSIVEIQHDGISDTDTEINHGTYQFTYY